MNVHQKVRPEGAGPDQKLGFFLLYPNIPTLFTAEITIHICLIEGAGLVHSGAQRTSPDFQTLGNPSRIEQTMVDPQGTISHHKIRDLDDLGYPMTWETSKKLESCPSLVPHGS